MRILYLDTNFRTMNPTRSLFPRMFSLAGDYTAFFGPGFVSDETLGRGLLEFVKYKGPFDVVAATEHVLFTISESSDKELKTFTRNNLTNFPAKQMRALPRMRREFKELDALKVAVILADYYNMPASSVDALSDCLPDVILGWTEQFVSPIEELTNINLEMLGVNPNNNWLTFAKKNRHRMFPLAHFVSDSEFDFTPLANREFDWCVPGVPYLARREASRILTKAKRRMSRHRLFHPQTAAAIATRIGIPVYSNSSFLSLYQESFRSELRRARIGFTCGSALRWPIRKFFEIPAQGTMLVSPSCNGYSDLGFRDGENSIVAKPEELLDVEARLSANPELAQVIAHAGQKLIGQMHTLSARGVQVRAAFEAAKAGRWRGAEWRDGQFVIH